MKATVQEMLAEMRKQEAAQPDPAAWEGFTMDEDTVVKDWLSILDDLTEEIK